MTEDELRATLRRRTDAVPGTPGLAQRAEQQGRRQQAGIRAAGAAGLVAALAITAVAVLPRTTATPTPPATGAPTASASASSTDAPVVGTFTTTASVDGIETSVTGPEVVDGYGTFPLVLTVTNPVDGSRWTGRVAAGLLYQQRVPGYFDGDLITTTGTDGYTQLSAALPTALTEKAFGGVQVTDPVTLEPGDTRTWTFQVQRTAEVPDDGGAQGWVAMLARDAAATTPGIDVTSGRALAFKPSGSALSCATPTVVGQRGDLGPWGLEYVATATVGSDRAATWVEVPGVDAEGGTTLRSTQTGNVLGSVVIQQLGDQGLAEASGFGADRPDQPATTAPGRYVAYSAVRMVDVDFSGTCAPSGEPISGTWRAYADRETGLLDCGRAGRGSPTELATLAEAYCPKP